MYDGFLESFRSRVDKEVSSKDLTIEDLNEFSNIFASEFNNSDIHDRVLYFQVIAKKEESYTGVDSENDESGTDKRSDITADSDNIASSSPKCKDKNEINEENEIDGNVCK